MQVAFPQKNTGQLLIVNPGNRLRPDQASEQPLIKLPDAATEARALVMWDDDVPYPNDPHKKPFLHGAWLSASRNNSATRNNGFFAPRRPAINYTGPNPPQDSDPHTYHLGLYRYLDGTEPRQIPKITDRKDFARWLTAWGLDTDPIAQTWFLSGYN